MPITNGTKPSVVRLRLRLLQPTYDILAEVAKRYGECKGFEATDSSGEPINLEPLLAMIAQHIDRFAELVPPPERKFFIRNGKLSVRRGSKTPKLTEDQIRQIRASTDKVICIAHEFGIAISTVSEIRTRKRYRYVV